MTETEEIVRPSTFREAYQMARQGILESDKVYYETQAEKKAKAADEDAARPWYRKLFTEQYSHYGEYRYQLRAPWIQMWVGALIVTALAVVIGAILGLVMGCTTYMKNLDKRECIGIERVIGQQTVWADYNFWSWDCLTMVDGQMIDAHDYKRVIQLRMTGGK